MLSKLKKDVCEANLALVRHGLVILTWGNASAIDRAHGWVVIKPSGVSYDAMTPEDMVVVDLEGKVVEGSLNPSSDTPTHLELYRRFDSIGGITHTHSTHAVMFAQAQREIPCFGTTHADQFYGAVPLTRPLSKAEIEGQYELETGHVIVERLAGMEPLEFPGVLVASHGPFTWGKTVGAAVENAVALEAIAQIALGTLQINPQVGPVDQYLLDKHYLRKHGPGAYYGQKK